MSLLIIHEQFSNNIRTLKALKRDAVPFVYSSLDPVPSSIAREMDKSWQSNLQLEINKTKHLARAVHLVRNYLLGNCYSEVERNTIVPSNVLLLCAHFLSKEENIELEDAKELLAQWLVDGIVSDRPQYICTH